MFTEIQGYELAKYMLAIRMRIETNVVDRYLVLQAELLQDNRCFEAVGCALSVKCDVGLDTHIESESFVYGRAVGNSEKVGGLWFVLRQKVKAV